MKVKWCLAVFIVVLGALLAKASYAGTIVLRNPADGDTLYYRTDAITSLEFEFSVSGVVLDTQLDSCTLTVEKGTKSESFDCATQLTDEQKYSIDTADLFSEMQSTDDPEGTYHFKFEIKWYDTETTDGDVDEDYTDEESESGLTIKSATYEVSVVFDDTPPAKVEEIYEPISGENALEVSWLAVEKDVNGNDEPAEVEYDICADPQPGKSSLADCEFSAEKVKGSKDGDRRSYKIDGLTNGTTYYVKVRAHDKSGNVGAFSDEVSGTPQPVADFWEYYKAKGGKETGGFCFVATAVFGGYDTPQVLVLRDFRDRVLMKFSQGRRFVAWYYANGKKLADFVAGKPLIRSAVKLGLDVAVAVLVVAFSPAKGAKTVALLLAIFLLALLVLRRRKLRKTAAMLLLATTSVVLLSASAKAESERTSALALFGGAYELSHIDDGISAKPAETVFGDTEELVFGLSYEHFLYASKPAGAITLGGGLFYYSVSGNGIYMGGANEGQRSGADSTDFKILPFRLFLSYRFEQLDSYFHVPLVPYVKAGVDYYIWWIKDNHGDIADYGDTKGRGGTFGFEAGGGILFLLDFLDPGVANNFDLEFGVNNTFIFFEYMYAKVDDFGSEESFDLSDDYFLVGLVFDF